MALLEKLAEKVILIDEKRQPLAKAISEADALVMMIAPKNGKGYRETYLDTAKDVAALREKHNPNLYIIYTSSTSVYHSLSENIALETTPLAPETENSRILIEVEQVLATNPQTAILRLGGIFGPGRELEKRASQMAGRILEGTGDEPTNHIHQRDIVKAALFCLTNRLKGVFNLVNDDHPSRDELYSSLCLRLGLKPPEWKASGQPQKKGVIVSNEKFRSIYPHPFISIKALDNSLF